MQTVLSEHGGAAIMTISMDLSQESYTITGGEQGKRRLNLLAEIFQPTTLRLLEDAGLRSGGRCLDLGCGGGHVALDMARIVGPDGFVTGLDFDPQIVELARQDAKDAGIGNVEYHVADAQTFDGGPFDLIYARFLLSHLCEPENLLARMRQLTRPGGRIVLEDIDMSGSYCHPHDPAHAQSVELYTKAVRRGGGDADLGRRIPAIALAAGLSDVHWNVFQPVHSNGPHKHLTAVTLDRIRPSVLRHGLATDQEIDSILARMYAFVQDPATLVALPRIVQVWGTA
jgi:2-polyprenyl-3-methyl-5-hydroxy-6-metoxy-1,4-benzoquinol methylase